MRSKCTHRGEWEPLCCGRCAGDGPWGTRLADRGSDPAHQWPRRRRVVQGTARFQSTGYRLDRAGHRMKGSDIVGLPLLTPKDTEPSLSLHVRTRKCIFLSNVTLGEGQEERSHPWGLHAGVRLSLLGHRTGLLLVGTPGVPPAGCGASHLQRSAQPGLSHSRGERTHRGVSESHPTSVSAHSSTKEGRIIFTPLVSQHECKRRTLKCSFKDSFYMLF